MIPEINIEFDSTTSKTVKVYPTTGPPKTRKSKKIIKSLNTKSGKNTLTRHARKRGGGFGSQSHYDRNGQKRSFRPVASKHVFEYMCVNIAMKVNIEKVVASGGGHTELD